MTPISAFPQVTANVNTMFAFAVIDAVRQDELPASAPTNWGFFTMPISRRAFLIR
jgi:hypothetical protein